MPCAMMPITLLWGVSSVRERDPFGDEQACGSLLGGVRGLAGGKICGLGGVDGGTGLDQNRDT